MIEGSARWFRMDPILCPWQILVPRDKTGQPNLCDRVNNVRVFRKWHTGMDRDSNTWYGSRKGILLTTFPKPRQAINWPTTLHSKRGRMPEVSQRARSKLTRHSTGGWLPPANTKRILESIIFRYYGPYVFRCSLRDFWNKDCGRLPRGRGEGGKLFSGWHAQD